MRANILLKDGAVFEYKNIHHVEYVGREGYPLCQPQQDEERILLINENAVTAILLDIRETDVG